MKSKVSVLTVTYGNREEYVKKIITNLKEDTNINEIIVVWNGNYPVDRAYFESSDIHNVFLKRNTGSANAYGEGIKYFLSVNAENSDYLWMLDDDNMPDADALETLLNDYEFNGNKKNVYCAFRVDRHELKKRGFQRYSPNSFFEFDVLKKLLRRKYTSIIRDKRYIRCETVPYGGMLISRHLVEQIGLPKKEMFLYSDDNEYTYRLTKSNIQLVTDTNAKIKDLEESWYRKEEQPMFQTVFYTDKLFNAVYTIRNRVYFEKNNIMTNKILYLGNIVVYLCYVFLFYMPKNVHGLKRFNLIVQLIIDGWHSKLGEISAETIRGWAN